MRIATVPSIPAPTQSYGYEDGPSGELVQQKPPVQGYTGRAGDLVRAGRQARLARVTDHRPVMPMGRRDRARIRRR